MATDDPRYIIKDIIDAITLTKDDDATAATILHEYDRGPEDMKYIFFTLDYDVLVKYGGPRVRSNREIQDVPVHYLMTYPVTVVTVDKRTALGALICTATTMQTKARTAIRTIVEANAQSAVPAYTLTIMREEDRDDWMGGINIWRAVYYLEYMTG